MIRSRMFTPGFKLFFGLALFLLFGAFIFGVSSHLQAGGTTISDQLSRTGIVETVSGPLSMGWKGPVGNHLGYTILLAGAGIAAFVAVVLVAFRDADPEAGAEILQVEAVPLTKAPSGSNFAPVIAAFSLVLIGVGWILMNTTPLYFYAGIALLLATMFTWTVRAWAERATGDDEINRQLYTRIIDPLRVPVVGALLVAFVVLGLSRVLLAAPSALWSAIIFGGAAVAFFAGVLAVYFMPRIARPLAVALVIVGALGILIGGIWGVAAGVRPIEHHGSEHSSPAGAAHGTEGGMAPVVGVTR
jgi:hypothetical protein